MVPIPVRVNPAPPGDRGHHLARLRVLGGDDAVEGRPDDHVLDLLADDLHLSLRNPDVLALALDARLQGGDLAVDLVEVGLTGDLLFDEAPRPLLAEARLGKLRLHFEDRLPRRRGLGFGEPERPLQVRGIEPGEHLSGGHLHALFDGDLGDLPRRLRGDRGLPPRGHVAARVQHRGAGVHRDRAHPRRPHRERLRLRPQQEDGRDPAADDEQPADDRGHQREGPRTPLLLPDLELGEPVSGVWRIHDP